MIRAASIDIKVSTLPRIIFADRTLEIASTVAVFLDAIYGHPLTPLTRALAPRLTQAILLARNYQCSSVVSTLTLALRTCASGEMDISAVSKAGVTVQDWITCRKSVALGNGWTWTKDGSGEKRDITKWRERYSVLDLAGWKLWEYEVYERKIVLALLRCHTWCPKAHYGREVDWEKAAEEFGRLVEQRSVLVLDRRTSGNVPMKKVSAKETPPRMGVMDRFRRLSVQTSTDEKALVRVSSTATAPPPYNEDPTSPILDTPTKITPSDRFTLISSDGKRYSQLRFQLKAARYVPISRRY